MKTNTKKTFPRSARDWQLYTDKPGAGAAAVKLSTALRTALKADGCTRATVQAIVGAAMVECREFGACDTEPCWVLRDVLDRKFGREL